MAPTRPGGPSADPGSLWPRQRRLGHASATLATAAAFRARFVGYFWHSRGQRVRGVAKEAGPDPPAEAGGAAVTWVTKPPTPAGGSRPVSETTIRHSRHANPRSPIGPLHRCGQQQHDLGRGPGSWPAHRAALTCPVKLDAEPSRGTQVTSVWPLHRPRVKPPSRRSRVGAAASRRLVLALPGQLAFPVRPGNRSPRVAPGWSGTLGLAWPKGRWLASPKARGCLAGRPDCAGDSPVMDRRGRRRA